MIRGVRVTGAMTTATMNTPTQPTSPVPSSHREAKATTMAMDMGMADLGKVRNTAMIMDRNKVTDTANGTDRFRLS